MSIQYHSTRGSAPHLDMRGVTLTGLAADGGLYVPKTWPEFSIPEIVALKDKPYTDIAQKILWPFVNSSMTDVELRRLLQEAYSKFDHPEITPLKQLSDRHWVMELFHGPTLAFKDIALQLVGGVFEHFLSQNNQRMTVVGATSGDTGSAAMMALAHRKNIDVFILYPSKGPSDIQRKQMTCIEAPNVHAMAIDGSFDDCQAIVKALFNDAKLRAKYSLGAVNSINWLRILAQMVYYFVASARFGDKPLSFVVPTGNFGNIYSAYAAMKSGLSISKLGVASNLNDILTRFFAQGQMKAEGVHYTLSPSMDIQVSSNFERLLFDLYNEKGEAVKNLMAQLQKEKEFQVTQVQLAMARQVFSAARATNEQTITTIQDVYKESGYVLDPHSAVGVACARMMEKELPDPIISLACAHPAKFPETIQRAIGVNPVLPPLVAELIRKPERQASLPADIGAVEKFISERVRL
ncbi:MAG: threonine synthase [Alphaproteobacteria bacterium]